MLEREIAKLDHVVYQAGLSLNIHPSSQDRLGLKHSRKDAGLVNIDETITPEFVSKLRELIKQYGARLYSYIPSPQSMLIRT